MTSDAPVSIDDFESDFYGALEKLANEVVATVTAETKGMTDAELKQYRLRGARDHLAELHKLKAPTFLIERAEQRIAQLEKEVTDDAQA